MFLRKAPDAPDLPFLASETRLDCVISEATLVLSVLQGLQAFEEDLRQSVRTFSIGPQFSWRWQKGTRLSPIWKGVLITCLFQFDETRCNYHQMSCVATVSFVCFSLCSLSAVFQLGTCTDFCLRIP